MPAKALIPLSILLLTITLFSSSSAHNITRLLSNYPNFSSFNSLLSSTNLADEINRRHTITVLAVSNDSIGSVVGLNPDLQHRILSVHVILDYFDLEKLQNLRNHSAILTTLFQTSGIAESRTGFLNVTKFTDGRVAFGSATPGASLVADLVGPVASRPYNLSVLQVSSVIIPPGIDGFNHNSTLSPPPSPPPTNAEAPAKGKAIPKAPSPSEEAPATDAEAPTADAPVANEAPVGAPVADSPDAKSPKGVADEEVKSGSGRLGFGASIGAIMGVVALIGWL